MILLADLPGHVSNHVRGARAPFRRVLEEIRRMRLAARCRDASGVKGNRSATLPPARPEPGVRPIPVARTERRA